jgi:hypothetical protein
VAIDADVYSTLKYKVVVDECGARRYFNGIGQLHCEEGPAIVYSDGSEEWFHTGERHRLDGPAVIWAEGSKFWYQNGVLHREDGPAVEYARSGGTYWFLFGVPYSRLQHQRKVEEIKRAVT